MSTREVYATFNASLPRICSHCGHVWRAQSTYTKSISGIHDIALETGAIASEDAPKELRRFDQNNEVLCPKCEHFSQKAMQVHFPNGLAAGLMSKYHKAAKWCAAVALPALLVSVLLFAIASYRPRPVREAISSVDALRSWSPRPSKKLLQISQIFSVALFGFGFYVGAGFIRAARWRKRIDKIVTQFSENDLLSIAVQLYKMHGNSLATGWWLKWGPWFLETSTKLYLRTRSHPSGGEATPKALGISSTVAAASMTNPGDEHQTSSAVKRATDNFQPDGVGTKHVPAELGKTGATIVASCPGCGAKCEFPESEIGNTACCSKCGLKFEVAPAASQINGDVSSQPAGKLGALARRIHELQKRLTEMASVSRVEGLNPVGALEGLKQGLAAMVNVLLTGKGPDGRPTGALTVGSVLKRICSDALENPAWVNPLKNSLGESFWKEAAAILEGIRAVASELEESGESDSEREAKQVQAKAVSRGDRKMEVIRKLQAIKKRCGTAGFIVGEIAKAMQTGVAADGKPTNRRDEIAALASVAQMLEAEGKQDVAVELVFIMKAIQELGED